MNTIKASPHYGIVVLRSAINKKGIEIAHLLSLMEESIPLGENDDLLSFGPHVGSEAANEFTKRLESLGLVYFDEFFVFHGDFPEWCIFKVSVIQDSAG